MLDRANIYIDEKHIHFYISYFCIYFHISINQMSSYSRNLQFRSHITGLFSPLIFITSLYDDVWWQTQLSSVPVCILNCLLPCMQSVSPLCQAASSIRACCGELVGGPPPVAKVMRKEAWHTQRRDRASGVPLEILEHLPPNQSLPTFCFVLSPTPLTLRGAVPHHLFRRRS